MNISYQPQDVGVCEQKIVVDGKELVIDRYKIYKELGRGANGVVFLALNETLGRYEAVKIWARLRPGDKRNKIHQGQAELKKIEAARNDYVVRVYGGHIIRNNFVGFFEYVEGETLGDFISKYKAENSSNNLLRVEICKMYVMRLRDLHTHGFFHGDPHLDNVLVYAMETPHGTGYGIKFLDFGISDYSNRGRTLRRQAYIVGQSVKNMVADIPTFEFFYRNLEYLLITYKNTDFIWHAFWKDVLDGMEFEAIMALIKEQKSGK